MTRHRRMSSDLDGSQKIEVVTDDASHDMQVVITDDPALLSTASSATVANSATSLPNDILVAPPPTLSSTTSQGTAFFSPHNNEGGGGMMIPRGTPFGTTATSPDDEEEGVAAAARSSSTGSGGSITMDYSDTSVEQRQRKSLNSATVSRRSKRDRDNTSAADLSTPSAFVDNHRRRNRNDDDDPTSTNAAALYVPGSGEAGTHGPRQLLQMLEDPDLESQKVSATGGLGFGGSAFSSSGQSPSPPAAPDSPSAHSNSNWMTKLAYSFRSPPVPASHKRISNHHHHHHHSLRHQHLIASTSSQSPSVQLLPYELRHQQRQGSHPSDNLNANDNVADDRDSPGAMGLPLSSSESTPLIADRKGTIGGTGGHTSGRRMSADRSVLEPEESLEEARRVRIAAAFLGDYIASRPPSLSHHLDSITDQQLHWHEIKYSTPYKVMIWIAVLLLFASCGFEYFRVDSFAFPDKFDRRIMTAMNLLAIAVLCVDLFILHSLQTGADGHLLASSSPTKGSSYLMPPSLSYYYFDEDPSNAFLSARDPQASNSRVGGEFTSSGGGGGGSGGGGKGRASPRSSDCHRLIKPMIVFAAFLTVENLARVLVVPRDTSTLADVIQDDVASSILAPNSGVGGTSTSGVILISSLFKPIVLFYVSAQARHALEALRRILHMVTRVLVMESLLILMFAAVGCRLFAGYEQFENLSTAWLSLFELSTTVVNPSIWMPMYRDYKVNAVFFILFVVICVFYLHSLVLSVVFSTYIYAASEIFERTASDREDSLRLAYRALAEGDEEKVSPPPAAAAAASSVASSYQVGGGDGERTEGAGVKISRLRPLLRRMRPHYSAAKISALWEIMEPYVSKAKAGGGTRIMDYPTFRQKIRQALNASIRTPRNASNAALAAELLAVVVAVVNFAYVIMASCQLDEPWFDDNIQAIVGGIITIVASAELLIRFNPLRIADFSPLTRLNATFDGLALTGAAISIVGMAMLPSRPETALEIIITGRALDMIRTMRFFRIFRDVVRRSTDVVPVLAGPAILVVSTLHIFVYLGIALWGGAVHIGESAAEIEPLYDLNNFNGYQEGVVTMFQVLVVNDWHSIAKVFLNADRCSHPWIVYPFFVLGNLIGVSVMLNVLTAFFVESFVTKINEDSDDNVAGTEIGKGGGRTEATPTTPTRRKDRGDFTIQTPENSRTVRRISSSTSSLFESHPQETSFDAGAGADPDFYDSDGSDSDFYEFDVYEREGLDKIMQTVAGVGSSSPYYNSEFARQLCDFFETFESLASEREPVGFLVCDQLTMERFGNRRFQNLSVGFMEASDLHQIVSDMHSELLALASRIQDRSLIRTFHQGNRVFEINATLLRRHPALSLFVTRVRLSPAA